MITKKAPLKRKIRYSPKGKPFNYKKIKCIECGETTKPNTNVAKYCSLTCQNRNRRRRNADTIRRYNYEYAIKNPEKVKLWKEKTNSNPLIKAKRNEWQKKYSKIKWVKDKINKRLRKRRKEEPSFRIGGNIRSRIHKKIKTYKKYGKTFPAKSERGVKINLIIKKLMTNLPKDYSNKQYHIDHIKPLCSFDLTDKNQLDKAFAPENHRWLTAEQNIKKGKEDRLQSIKILGR